MLDVVYNYQPMFIVGRRMNDIKGYYFTLLTDEESFKITPILEKMLVNRPKASKIEDGYESPAWNTANSNDDKLKPNTDTSSPARYVHK